jgi:hypothetical protein
MLKNSVFELKVKEEKGKCFNIYKAEMVLE